MATDASTQVHAVDQDNAQNVSAHDGAHGACPDCGAEARGKFCVDCGQEIHVHRTLFHLGHELLHGVMHFDGRFWRTLPLLLVNPGKLTREWIQGKRTSYISPLAMFLCTLFVLFMALSFMPPPSNVVVNMPNRLDYQKAKLVEIENELAQARQLADGTLTAAAVQSTAEPDAEPFTEEDAAKAVASIPELEADLARRKARLAELEIEERDGRKDGLKAGSWQAQVADLKWDDADNEGSLNYSVAKKLKNPDLALYKLQQTTYKFAFLLVPFSIPFMALLFLWSRKFTLYDHGVFVLYSLTFMSMLLMLGVALRGMFPGALNVVSGLCMAVAPVHIFAQLKGTYELGVWGALWRTMMLSVFCTMVISFFIIAIIYLGLGH